MYDVSAEYLSAISRRSMQHIIGMITLLDGRQIALDENIIGRPSFNTQCTEDVENFAIGQLYTGEVELSIKMPDIERSQLRGGTVVLLFRVTGAEDRVPLGVWTITDPQRTDEHTIAIRGADCISKLDVPITDNTVGNIKVAARMAMVRRLTGVEFAQTVAELTEMSGIDLENRFGSTFAPTCRAEVAYLAQLMGCIAYADRFGRIAFRKIGTSPVLTIPAELRHKASLCEYSYGIRGVQYTDAYGVVDAVSWEKETAPNTSALVALSTGNPYIWDGNSSYSLWLEPIADNLRDVPDWTPGEVDYYGDPALDLGDMVQLSGGITSGESTLFLITGINWQFRGPQTLISAGAGETASDSTTAGSSGASSVMTVINNTKTNVAVDLEPYEGELFPELRKVAEGAFSVRGQTLIFVELTATVDVEEASRLRFHVLYDGVKQTVHSIDTVRADTYCTVSFTVPLTAEQGRHSVSIEADGSGYLDRINACVWGQDITAEISTHTYPDDYIYHADTIDKYIGMDDQPAIPSQLGGMDIKVLGADSFTHSAVRYVYIPKGVERIE